MSRKIFVNLPIKNMENSQAFFKSLDFSFDPHFTNEQGACLVISENHNYVMLLVEPFLEPSPKNQLPTPAKPPRYWCACPAKAARKSMRW